MLLTQNEETELNNNTETKFSFRIKTHKIRTNYRSYDDSFTLTFIKTDSNVRESLTKYGFTGSSIFLIHDIL